VEGYLTIKEAARRLGISERTVRRRIKDGSLPAELKQGDYGQQYFIPADVIETAQVITDVVEVKRVHDGQALSMAIVRAMEERDKALEGELIAMREELAATREALEDLKNEISQQQRRPWWKWWK
jgi:excisionase family DNA binding protein